MWQLPGGTERYLQMNRLAEVRAIAEQAMQMWTRRTRPTFTSLDGGYGVKSNAKPKLNQQPSRFSISESAKKTGHYL